MFNFLASVVDIMMSSRVGFWCDLVCDTSLDQRCKKGDKWTVSEVSLPFLLDRHIVPIDFGCQGSILIDLFVPRDFCPTEIDGWLLGLSSTS